MLCNEAFFFYFSRKCEHPQNVQKSHITNNQMFSTIYLYKKVNSFFWKKELKQILLLQIITHKFRIPKNNNRLTCLKKGGDKKATNKKINFMRFFIFF